MGLGGADEEEKGELGGLLGSIRDLHNDEPKSIACTTDMLLSASIASTLAGRYDGGGVGGGGVVRREGEGFGV